MNITFAEILFIILVWHVAGIIATTVLQLVQYSIGVAIQKNKMKTLNNLPNVEKPEVTKKATK